jgi:serine/threonine protein kinase
LLDSIFFDFGQGIRSESGTWYKVVQTLGTGGNSVTVLVVATSGLNKGVPFALKVFRRLSKPDRREAFLREAAFLEECDHAAIMRVFDKGTFRIQAAECPFIVMEYLPDTLAQVIGRKTATTVEKLCYGSQLLSALDYLSRMQPSVIHRDVKPQNIFVKGHTCVLGDFGLMISEGQTGLEDDRDLVRESIGMPFFYRTPDLVAYARGERPLTSKSDVFQLGLTLAQLFTGWNPEVRANDFLDPVVLDEIGAIPGEEMSGSIYTLLSRMLRLDANDRETAGQLMDGWQGLLNDACMRARALNGKAL